MTTYTIGFLLYDDVEELDFIGPLEVFNTSNDIARKTGKDSYSDTILMSLSGRDIVGTKGMRINVDYALEDAPDLDVLCVPGGRGVRAQLQNKELLDWISTKAADCTWTACVGTGIFLLSAAGLVGNKKLATHWSAQDEFAELNLKGSLSTPSRYIRDGNLLTSSGASASIDMCLWLNGRLHSISLAAATQRALQHDRQPTISTFG